MSKKTSADPLVETEVTGKKPRIQSDLVMDRDAITPRPLDSDARYLKIISWNVAGLRGTLKNSPTILQDLVNRHRPDALCLQETKLQESHVSELTDMLPGYVSHWACSTTKKGYSGVALFVKSGAEVSSVSADTKKKKKGAQTTLTSLWKTGESSAESLAESVVESVVESEGADYAAKGAADALPLRVECNLPDARFNGEGRIIVAEFPAFFLVNVYVPNSGDGLVRLGFRVDEWYV